MDDKFREFRPGAICRLMLENFMCTDVITYNFNPNTNFIVGPNGNGKSTIVCALYLLFNGDVKKLGRCKTLAEFVNHDRNKNPAKITVTIKKKDGRSLRLKRIINFASKDAHWLVKAKKGLLIPWGENRSDRDVGGTEFINDSASSEPPNLELKNVSKFILSSYMLILTLPPTLGSFRIYLLSKEGII